MSQAVCEDYVEGGDSHLHAEIEHLKQHLAERDAHIEAMETEFLKGNTTVKDLEEQLVTWKEKYDRLYDSHKRVQRVNQSLEDKLLHMADKCTVDKAQLTRDVETLSVRLAESNYTIGHLHKENERYKNDMNLAIQLLQCKPDNFVTQKFDALPSDTQARVSTYIMSKARLSHDQGQSPISGRPSTTSADKINPEDFEFNISASLMSKILEESVQNTICKHCDTCSCLNKAVNPFSYAETHYTTATQTHIKGDHLQNSLCVNCNSDLKSNISARCISPGIIKPAEIKEAVQTFDNEVMPSPIFIVKHPVSKKAVEDKTPSKSEVKVASKASDETLKLVGGKHREIMSKIGENLKEMNLEDEFIKLQPLELTGHHRLCDRTKPSICKQTGSCTKSEEDLNDKDCDGCLPQVIASPKHPEPANCVGNEGDITFGQIENYTVIRNETRAKTKSDLNSMENVDFRHNSISSNDAESKASSHSKNNSSQSGSNTKVQIGPGPRFCSLRMQAGSKNILLANAQPNIAPVLYTRQTKNLDTSPLSIIPGNDDHHLDGLKVNSGEEHHLNIVENINRAASSASSDRIINILDTPNEELVVGKPLELCEKTESGYKSNESAEIIDKLLFVENTIQEAKSSTEEKKLSTTIDSMDKAGLFQLMGESHQLFSDAILKSDMNAVDKNVPNVKVFNFDQYEMTLKHPSMLKIQIDRKIEVSHLNNLENTKIPADSRLLINDATMEVFNADYDLKVASKNLSEINKKFTRNTANQTLPEGALLENSKEWKKEVSTEKSSSSLSSDESAAILQQQQLMRVAEWVQKNLELEHQIDLDNSDSCQQSIEEMHHVRNDFPRPAKVEHRLRKVNSKPGHKVHHASKQKLHKTEVKPKDSVKADEVSVDYMTQPIQACTVEVSEAALYHQDVKNSNSDYAETHTSSTNRSCTREELARMEYNVKQFLLNGTRWSNTPNDNCYSKARRTSSKTETDL